MKIAPAVFQNGETEMTFDDLQGSDGNNSTSELIASIFSDAASVASTAIATSNQPAPPLYNYGSGSVIAGAGLMPQSGNASGLLIVVALGAVAYLLLRKRG